jgi:DNA polymerase sigma
MPKNAAYDVRTLESKFEQLAMQPRPELQDTSAIPSAVPAAHSAGAEQISAQGPSDTKSPTAAEPATASSASSQGQEAAGGDEKPVESAKPREKIIYEVAPNSTLPARPRDFAIPIPTRDAIFRLTRDMIQFYEEIQPPASELAQRMELLRRLQQLVSSLWPHIHARLHLFGSSSNTLCLRVADTDLCLEIDPAAGSKEDIIETLGRALKNYGMSNVLPLASARVPIVKFMDPASNISCDVCINNLLALSNSRLLADYTSLDARVRPLVLIVKYWAKRRQINKPYEGTISSYAFVLMVINFLQQRKPPILPCLQRMLGTDTTPVVVQGFDCSYFKDLDQLRGFGALNRETLGELLLAFFRYYAHEFDYKNLVISVRTGGMLDKEDKDWVKPQCKDNCVFTVEDPFEVTHNLGRVVDRDSLWIIRYEFLRAYRVLASSGGNLRQLLRPFPEDADERRMSRRRVHNSQSPSKVKTRA